jgi:hypothetical protein
MAFSKQMQIEDIYAELGIKANSKSSNIMLGIEDSRKTELAMERNQKRLEKVRQKELERSHSHRFEVEREDKSLQFRVKEPGQIECGLPQLAFKPDDTSKTKVSTFVEDLGSSIGSSHSIVSLNDDDYEQHIDKVDGETGKWKRVTSEQYVDFYLNGGKYEPPTDSLMEEGPCCCGGGCGCCLQYMLCFLKHPPLKLINMFL